MMVFYYGNTTLEIREVVKLLEYLNIIIIRRIEDNRQKKGQTD